MVLLAACNSVFGLRPPIETDARQYDAGIDAPSRCPQLQTAPRFSPVLHQVFVQDCRSYAISRTGRAMATCRRDGISAVYEGPADQELTPAIGFDEPGVSYHDPRLSPDGQKMLVRRTIGIKFEPTAQYARNPDGSWRRLPDPPFGANVIYLGTIAAGPTGDHVLVQQLASTPPFHEWVDEAGAWRELHGFELADLGSAPTMTLDGLHGLAVASNPPHLLFLDRDDVSQPFRAPIPIEGVLSDGVDAYLTEDCERIYVTGLGSVFYAQQQ